MCPYGAKLLTGEGGVTEKTMLCAHVLLIEAADSLVLVDTGFGTGDVADPKHLGQPFRALVRPIPDLADTALHQIRALGLDPADVRHIAATHLDVDHAGGLPDFPEAEVHVFRPEMEAAVKPSICRTSSATSPSRWRMGRSGIRTTSTAIRGWASRPSGSCPASIPRSSWFR